MKENYSLKVDLNKSLPILENGEFIYPEIQNCLVDKVLESKHITKYYLLGSSKKISSVLYELHEKNLIEKTLGLQEGYAIRKMGEEFFREYFGFRSGITSYLWRSVMKKEGRVYVPSLFIPIFPCQKCCGEGDNEEIAFQWRFIEEWPYFFEEKHVIYNKNGNYVSPTIHEILS